MGVQMMKRKNKKRRAMGNDNGIKKNIMEKGAKIENEVEGISE